MARQLTEVIRVWWSPVALSHFRGTTCPTVRSTSIDFCCVSTFFELPKRLRYITVERDNGFFDYGILSRHFKVEGIVKFTFVSITIIFSLGITRKNIIYSKRS